MRLQWSLVAFAGLAACSGPRPAAPARADSTSSIAGTWITEGYGLAIDVGADTLRAYEVTKVSCLPGFTAKRVGSPPGTLGAFTLVGDPVTFVVLPDSGDRARIHGNGAASDMIARRADRKPATCDRPAVDSPNANFDVFAETWAENYPFFSDKHADWAATVAASRGKVAAATTPEQLFELLKGMIAPLEDAHTFLGAPTLKLQWGGGRKTESSLGRDDGAKAYRLIGRYLAGPLHAFCEGQLEFGMLGTDVGYLRLRSFGRYSKDGSFETGLVALEAALDTVFRDSGSWKGFVLDIRINGGGADPYGLAIASRLATAPYLAYAKQAWRDPADPAKWTSEQPSRVVPSTRPGYHGPVVELIGVQSVSAAETFTQALLGREPKVTKVGENTQGVFSDVLVRHLPNGWVFGLPNERFVTDGKSYDGPGIAPDVALTSFTPAGLKSGRDAGVERAIALLRR